MTLARNTGQMEVVYKCVSGYICKMLVNMAFIPPPVWGEALRSILDRSIDQFNILPVSVALIYQQGNTEQKK